MCIARERDWIAPENARLPDFIICGAMKCGTSTLHSILHKHPEIYIPEPEVNFFDMDDLFQHSDFYFFGKERWWWPNIADSPREYWNWYQRFFEAAPANSLIGEDSTCYLPSSKAAFRISLQPKRIKAIICLRQPTERAYSQYLHMLRTGRAMFDFEDTIKFTPHYVLERSMYLNQIMEFVRFVPRERIFFFILEKFLADKERAMRDLSDFLSVDYDDFPKGALHTHANAAVIPRSLGLQILKNRLFRSFGNTYYNTRLPLSTEAIKRNSFFAAALRATHNRLNFKAQPVPPMNPATKEFLNAYFQREMQGLGELIGVDVDQLWFRNKAGEQYVPA